MRNAWWLLIIFAAGCAGPATTEVPEPPSIEVTTEWRLDASSCRTTSIVWPISYSHAAKFIPPGYAVRDAADFVNDTLPPGNAVLAVSATACREMVGVEGNSWTGWAAIYVHPPVIEGVNDTAEHDFYVLQRYVTEGPVAQWFAAAHDPVHPLAEFAIDVEDLGQVRSADVVARDNGGPVFSFTGVVVADAVAGPPSQYLRLWHESVNGTSVHDVQQRLDYGLGAPAECEIRQNSILQDAAPEGACTTGRPILAVLAQQDVPSALRFLPGVFAQ